MGELLRSSYEEERSEYDPHNPDIVAFNMRLAQKHANDPFVLLDHDPVRYTFQGHLYRKVARSQLRSWTRLLIVMIRDLVYFKGWPNAILGTKERLIT